jgi:serine protease Do
MRFNQFFKKHNLLTIILITIILGLGGGFVGEILTRVYLMDTAYNFSPFGNLDFSADIYKDRGIVINNARNVIVQEDVKISETINSVTSSLVGIYKKQKPATSDGSFNADNFYKLAEPSGQGFVLTADGWIVTRFSLGKNINDYVVITKDRNIYSIDKVEEDNLTEFYFIHVNAKDLSVRKFVNNQDIKRGSLTVGVNWLDLSWVSSVVGFSGDNSLVKSSDNFSRKLILNNKFPQEFKDSVIFNLAGDTLGLIDNRGEIEPISHLASAAESLFKYKTVKRPSLGVNYINLSGLLYYDSQNINWQKGAIIYRNIKLPAVQKNSPASQAGLREGDIVISVNNIIIDKDNDLSGIIQNYTAGDIINLIYLRANQEYQTSVTLGEIK